MKLRFKLLAGVMLAALSAGSVSAKTLVYCSEGSPERIRSGTLYIRHDL